MFAANGCKYLFLQHKKNMRFAGVGGDFSPYPSLGGRTLGPPLWSGRGYASQDEIMLMMSNPYGYLKKCRRCLKEQHASKFPKQRPAPGQMPLCQSCRDEIAAEKADADQ